MEKKIRVMIVDDHEVVRIGLRSLLSLFPHIEIVAEASNAQESILLSLEKQPDVVLMDIRLPGVNGIEACREIKSKLPKTHLLMLTSYDGNDLVKEALTSGASGYVLKEASAQGLIQAIESVIEGQQVLDEAIKKQFAHNLKATLIEKDLINDLNQVQKQILKHICNGKTNREIAKLMSFSEKTIQNYVSMILEKLGLHNRTEAAAFAIRHGLNE